MASIDQGQSVAWTVDGGGTLTTGCVIAQGNNFLTFSGTGNYAISTTGIISCASIPTLSPNTAFSNLVALGSIQVGSGFSYTGGAYGAAATQSSTVAANARIDILLNPPRGCTINSVSFRIDPPNGHGALPVSMPSITLYEWGVATDISTPSFTASAVDTSASVAAFEAAHDVTLTLSPARTSGAGKLFLVTITGESGTNSLTNGLYGAPRINGSYTTLLWLSRPFNLRLP